MIEKIKLRISEFFWYIKRTYRKIKRVIDFLPILWNGYDFDYHYAIELFQHQLKRTADYMESDRAMALDADRRAKKIRTAVELLEKVYDDSYACEYQQRVTEKYGEDALDWYFEPTGKVIDNPFGKKDEELYLMKWEYEKWDNADEIKKFKDEEFRKSQQKQKRAEELVWKFIGHHIRGWWD